MERAKREELGRLCLDGCQRPRDRALVDEQVRLLLAAEPGCRLLSARPTAAGYWLNLGRAENRPPAGPDWGHADPPLPLDKPALP